MLLRDPTREERREQLVALDPVVEGVDQPLERLGAAGPFVEARRRVGVWIGDRLTLAAWAPQAPRMRLCGADIIDAQRAISSVGQSASLIRKRSLVRVQDRP
jgi:hypothetical protein